MLSRLLLILVAASWPGMTHAMSMKAVTDPHQAITHINLWGSIEQGDALAFRKLVAPLLRNGYAVVMVNVSSRGGLMDEAMEIGDQVRLLRAQTRVPQSSMVETAQCAFAQRTGSGVKETSSEYDPAGEPCTCASACFFIWMSGTARFGNTIGVHHFTIGFSQPVPAWFKRRSYETTRMISESYMLRRGVPAAIVARMFATPYESIYFLNEREIASVRDGSDASTFARIRCGQPVAASRANDGCLTGVMIEQARAGARAYLQLGR